FICPCLRLNLILRHPCTTLFPYPTLFRSALDFDAAAHPLDDAPGDGEAETGATEFSCRSAVGLLEFVKDARLLSGRNADAAVAKDRKSTRLNSSHLGISYAVFCLKKKKIL